MATLVEEKARARIFLYIRTDVQKLAHNFNKTYKMLFFQKGCLRLSVRQTQTAFKILKSIIRKTCEIGKIGKNRKLHLIFKKGHKSVPEPLTRTCHGF